MLLKDLILDLENECETCGNLDITIDELITDSRKESKNGLFFCISGLRFDGHDFAAQAIQNGCCALLVERFLDVDVPQICVKNSRRGMALVASAFFGHPAKALRMIGVCGTKGKTTTSYLLKAVFEAAGMKTGLIGTTGNMIAEKHLPSNMTTPDPVELYRTLRQMADEGVEAVSMEVSAHAVAMNRVDAISFEAACYTNLSQDHLDYFGTMENYFQTKKSFFTDGLVRNASLNADDETTARIVSELSIPHLTYSISAVSDVYARDIEINENGVSFDLHLHGIESIPVNMHLTGMFNVYNALAAASTAMIMGIDSAVIKQGLESVHNVPGRVEVLDTLTPYKVILDYAHSPAALENVLKTIRAFTKKRLIALVGCGGDRDQGKRPIMGEIVGRMADFSILTSDNPRNENPFDILDSIEEGMKRTKGAYVVIENRREAIRYALTLAQEGDVIILAGKGNETYQEIKGVKHPFNAKTVVHELLDEMNQK